MAKQAQVQVRAGDQLGTALGMFSQHSDVALALAVVGVLLVLIVPIPTFLLDILLSMNIAVSLLLLMVALSAAKALEFSTFPSLLLFTTLLRLSLNVATTRLVLLNGYAGEVINAFGHFVVGGNLVVGLVVFLILCVIQFVVIIKGAGRISEVAARFTLDAMPGKQMAIDADLNAGLINEQDARERRAKIAQEAEFYGAMDGASKFVRGDAVAGMVIIAVNLVGGIVMGKLRGMSIADAIQTYSILTVGDGLVTQIPSLIIATTSGVITTKASSSTNLAKDVEQRDPRPPARAGHRRRDHGAVRPCPRPADPSVLRDRRLVPGAFLGLAPRARTVRRRGAEARFRPGGAG